MDCDLFCCSPGAPLAPVAEKGGQRIFPVGRRCFRRKPSDHFVVYNEMVPIGSNAERQVDTVKMTRFACYLTVQNADSSKTIFVDGNGMVEPCVRCCNIY